MTVVFDLDGTTIFKGQPMSETIFKAIQELKETRNVIFASARPIRDMLPVLPTEFHDFDLIGGNGAFIRTNNEISTITFSEDEKKTILRLIEKHQLNYMVDSDWDYAYSGDTTHPLYLGIDPNDTATNMNLSELKSMVKTVLFTTDESVINDLRNAGLTVHFHGNENLIDISPSGISKWSGYSRLYPEKPFIMFGNDANDLPMFEKSAENFVVGNLIDNVVNATYITEKTLPEAIVSLAK